MSPVLCFVENYKLNIYLQPWLTFVFPATASAAAQQQVCTVCNLNHERSVTSQVVVEGLFGYLGGIQVEVAFVGSPLRQRHGQRECDVRQVGVASLEGCRDVFKSLFGSNVEDRQNKTWVPGHFDHTLEPPVTLSRGVEQYAV